MEQPHLIYTDNDRCEFLRWKGLYVNDEQNPNISQSGDRIFWCVKTQKPLGPDGKLVDDYECNAARGCFRML